MIAERAFHQRLDEHRKRQRDYVAERSRRQRAEAEARMRDKRRLRDKPGRSPRRVLPDYAMMVAVAWPAAAANRLLEWYQKKPRQLWIAYGGGHTTRAERDARLRVCGSCPKRTVGRSLYRRERWLCSACGCGNTPIADLRHKTSLADFACPEQRFGASPTRRRWYGRMMQTAIAMSCGTPLAAVAWIAWRLMQ